MRSLQIAVWLFALVSAQAALAVDAMSRTTLGRGNEYLSRGAEAMRMEQYELGVRLTLRGLDEFPMPKDRADGLSNLCAGYIGLEDFERAIESCDRSLEINPRNWHAYHNRAVANLRQNKLEEALVDLEAGLAVNPHAEKLVRAAELTRASLISAHVIMKESY